METQRKSCAWCMGDPLLRAYHDLDWGMRQVHDDALQFEYLILETMQCGLSWMTVLRKREVMRRAFDQFDPERIAAYDEEKVRTLLMMEPDASGQNIIRSAGKIGGMVTNARCFLKIAEERGSFDQWFWDFTGGRTLVWPAHQMNGSPAKNVLSERMSKEMKQRGFKYLGPVVLYSHMQAVGMINDHALDCFGYDILGGEVQNEDSDYGL